MPETPLVNKVKTFAKEGKSKITSLKGKKKKQIIIAGVLVIVIIAGAVFGGLKFFGGQEASAIQTAVAQIGNVSNIIEGSGAVEAINQYEVTALVTGEILSDHFEEGDYINEGDLMYTIDSSEVQNSIQRAQQSLEKSQLSYQQSAETVANLNVYAGVSGVITELYVNKGDQISNNSKVAEIINTDYMLLKIQFNSVDAQNIYAGQSATVNLESSFTTLYGEVTYVATGSVVNDDGVPVTNVEIAVSNPGAVLPGERATAIVGSYACNSPGTFEYFETETVIAKASGEVAALNYHVGDKIQAGSRLITIESDSAVNSARQSQLSVQDAQVSLQDTYDKLDDYNITAPISGKVIQKTSKAGEKIDNSSSKTTMAIIADMSTLIFEMSVDELDISSIEVGQTVEITADAIENKTFQGYVDNVSIVGTTQMGVTSYPVKIVIENGEESGLLPGMNVNASIVVESRENVLTVPLSAINRGNTVTVKKSGNNDESRQTQEPSGERGTEGAPEDMKGQRPEGAPEGMPEAGAEGAPQERAQNPDERMEKMLEAMSADVPDGFEVVRVEIGLSDDTNVEIISGLSEGDIVLLPDKTTTDTTTQQQQMPGMGGGMPGGGMPGGGMGGGMPGGGGMGGGPR